MKLTTLTKMTDRNEYGDLNVDFTEAIHSAYPSVGINFSAPGCWGHSADLTLDGTELTVPDGKYTSNKHFHTAGHSIIEVESGKRKLNKRPLFLLSGRAYNGDYKSLKQTYFLFAQNEDKSFFLHKVRPSYGESGLKWARAWMWSIKKDETIEARQGDLAFIRKKRKAGSEVGSTVEIGNHTINADQIFQTKHRTYAVNPVATHGEHHSIELDGVYELRLAKVWGGGCGD